MRPVSAGRIFLAAKAIAPEKEKMPISIPDPASRPDYFTLREFAAVFGRERRWAKRQIERGNVNAVRSDALSQQLWIPQDQIESILSQQR